MGEKGRYQVGEAVEVERYYLPIKFTEDTRTKVGLVLALLHILVGFCCIGVTGIGIFTKLALAEYTNLISGYDGNAVIYVLITLGATGIIANRIGAYYCYTAIHPDNRRGVWRTLQVYQVVLICSTVYAALGGWLCFFSIAHLEDSFRGGIKVAMGEYQENIVVKAELHDLQFRFKCCGDESFQDWFKVAWVRSEFDPVNFHSTEKADRLTGYYHDDVPSSCCNKISVRPCINMDVLTNEKHHNYRYDRDMTVYQEGCTKQVMQYFGDTLLTNSGAMVFFMFITQLVMCVLLRYFITSIVLAISKNKPQAMVYAYFYMRTVKLKEDEKLQSKTRLVVEAVKSEDENDLEEGYRAIPSPRISQQAHDTTYETIPSPKKSHQAHDTTYETILSPKKSRSRQSRESIYQKIDE